MVLQGYQIALDMELSPGDGRGPAQHTVWQGCKCKAEQWPCCFLLQPRPGPSSAPRGGKVFAKGSDPGWKLSKASCKHRLMGWGTYFKHYGKHLGRVPFKWKLEGRELTDVCFYQSCSLFCRAREPTEVKKLMGEVGIKQKDQMHQVIAEGIKTIQHLRAAINVKCCSLISDIWLTASKYTGDCTVRGKMRVSWNAVKVFQGLWPKNL